MTDPPPNSIHPLSREEWRSWLAQHHTRMEGVWLISYKKATGKPRFDYEEAVEEALCFGWVDSKGKKPETRARRIEETARLAAQNQRANQWRP